MAPSLRFGPDDQHPVQAQKNNEHTDEGRYDDQLHWSLPELDT
jgi:hypothetical protein